VNPRPCDSFGCFFTRLRRLACLGLTLCLGLSTSLQTLAQDNTDSAASTPAAQSQAAFSLSVDAPQALAEGLVRHLELQRYKDLPDLDATELQRLLDMADTQARELLATWGHFAPRLQWQTEAASTGGPGWQVRLQVEPGPIARIQAVHWRFQGHLQDSEAHALQRQALQQQWGLPVGRGFSQETWSEAKAAALRQLTTEHYPLGHWAHTEARVDPERSEVVLELVLDSGPEVFLGPVVVQGQSRYSLEQARRLANLPTGRSYRQADLLEAQQRLVLSGFYDAVFVSLDTEGPASAMPVRIELKETQLQRWQLGLGVRSDSGPRLSLEHTQHRVPGLDWRAVTRVSVDRVLQSAALDLLAPPDDSLWRWNLSGKVEHQQFSDYAVSSQRLRAGQAQLGERIDRTYYAQYDMAHNTGALSGIQEAASAHYAWTWRRFDSIPFPSQGWGLGLEVGAGVTLGSERVPYTRSRAKLLWLLPLGTPGQRLSLRGEMGAVATRQADNIPSTQLFLAGGDLSVRGYAPGSIGVSNANGTVTAGRYLNTGSIEWQVPLGHSGRRSEWDGLLFIDTGAVANTLAEMKPRVGAGVGARWRSPVGPLEIDLAQARDTGRWRLHMNVGFRF
jgi:translocation and assembly module TamA